MRPIFHVERKNRFLRKPLFEIYRSDHPQSSMKYFCGSADNWIDAMAKIKKLTKIYEGEENMSEKMQDGGKRETYDSGAIREPSSGKGAYELMSPFALERIAKWYELGAQKYSERNWEQGIPFGRLIQSATRHIMRWEMGDRSEDHLAAVCWNVMAMMHFEATGQDKELNNYPKYGEETHLYANGEKVNVSKPAVNTGVNTDDNVQISEEYFKKVSEYTNRKQLDCKINDSLDAMSNAVLASLKDGVPKKRKTRDYRIAVLDLDEFIKCPEWEYRSCSANRFEFSRPYREGVIVDIMAEANKGAKVVIRSSLKGDELHKALEELTPYRLVYEPRIFRTISEIQETHGEYVEPLGGPDIAAKNPAQKPAQARTYKIIAVDFDGTLCENEWPHIGYPNWRLINKILVMKSRGDKFILWTCREGELLDQAIKWYRERGLIFDAVNENLPEMIELYGNNCRKISADEYWDDKGVTVKA